MLAAGSNKPTLVELDQMLDRDARMSTRTDYRTRVQVIGQSGDGADVHVGWIKDVSTTGAMLLTPHSVFADRFWIRVTGTALQGEFIECHIRWRENLPDGTTQRTSDGMYFCGVQFDRMLSRDEFDTVLSAS